MPYLRGRVLDYGCGSGALAQHCLPTSYLGIDRSETALNIAQSAFPSHEFACEIDPNERFDTVVALAVIEHLKHPVEWLTEMKSHLRDDGSLVLTTPHPLFRKLHDLGALFGVFSREASEEHETFFDADDLRKAGERAGLVLARYGRFLLGANQIAVFRKASD